jgi:L-2-hydroxyglutarate oxidase LhgO
MSTDPDWDVVVIGAGVVGLACAAQLSGPHRRVLVIEQHDGICREGSSRNSEVIHAGIYYPKGSLKALSCAAGRRAIYRRAAARGIPVRRCGKLIVASSDEEAPLLTPLLERAQANGVDDLELISSTRIAQLEPGTQGVAALWSPSSGIVDSHQLAISFQSEAEAAGATLSFRTRLTHVEPTPRGYLLTLSLPLGPNHKHPQEQETFTTSSRVVVNAAGVGQDTVSAQVGINVDSAGYRQFLCKGDWFRIAERHRGRLQRLVYPVGRASDGGLGIHSCMDIEGGLRLGPDAEWVSDPPPSLQADPAKQLAFWKAGVRLFPWLALDDLRPDQAGLRPKLSPKDGVFSDFILKEESSRNLPGWITLAGIESPGLTAAPELARRVGLLVDEVLS